MIRALLIDDEKPALLQLERLLRKDSRIQIEGMYVRASEGLAHVRSAKVDVVFLDIGMPGMNGLEAGERLLALDPDLQIIYVTAYADYAVEAFELNALDYLLKPIEPARLDRTLERLSGYFRLMEERAGKRSGRARVQCLKRLALFDEAGRPVRWRTQKAQELFAFLVHHRRRWSLKEVILETIWPKLDADKATTHLHTTIYQIRKLLKDNGIPAKIEYAHESYRFDAQELFLDVDRFVEVAGQEVVDEQGWKRLYETLVLYEGDYLEEPDYMWAKPMRDELLRLFILASFQAAEYEIRTRREPIAVQRLAILQDKEPFSDEICRYRLRAYALIGDMLALKTAYDAFVLLLRKELDIEPEPATVKLYNRLIQEGSLAAARQLPDQSPGS